MQTEVKIKRIELSEIGDLATVLQQVVKWLNTKSDGSQWDELAISRRQLIDEYGGDSIYVGYADGVPVCSVVVQDLDPLFWPHITDDSSLFIHKLAVTEEFRGSGLSSKMVKMVIELARKQGRDYVRLDCVSTREKLCEFYRKLGFVKVGLASERDYHTALFELQVSES